MVSPLDHARTTFVRVTTSIRATPLTSWLRSSVRHAPAGWGACRNRIRATAAVTRAVSSTAPAVMSATSHPATPELTGPRTLEDPWPGAVAGPPSGGDWTMRAKAAVGAASRLSAQTTMPANARAVE